MDNTEILKKMDQIILLLKNGQFAVQQPTKKLQKTKTTKSRKRGNDDMQRGSITYRSDGRWMGRCYDENKKQKCVYARTKKECAEKLKLTIDEVERRKLNPETNSSMKLNDYFETWLNLYKIPVLKESSIIQIRRTARTNLKSLGEFKIKDITVNMLQTTINSINSLKTRMDVYSYLSQMYEKLFFMGVIPQNLMGLVVLTKQEKNTIKVLDEDNAKQILELGEEDTFVYKKIETKFKMFIEFAINTGMRPAEILGLQRQDIDLENKTIIINKQMNTTTGKVSTPKTKKGNRIIPIFEKTKQILLSMNVQEMNDEEFIFKLKYSGIRQYLERLSEKRGETITCKTFRKTFSSRCQHVYGIDPKQVQNWLGHESYETTDKHYTYISNEEMSKNIDKYNSSTTHIADTHA